MIPQISARSNVDPFVRDVGAPTNLELVIPTGEGAGVVIVPLSFAAIVGMSRELTAFVARKWQSNYRNAGDFDRDKQDDKTQS